MILKYNCALFYETVESKAFIQVASSNLRDLQSHSRS